MFLKRNLIQIGFFVLVIIVIFFVLTATGLFTFEGLWLVTSTSNIRISTVITIIFCFTLVLALQGKIFWRPLYYAILAIIFSLGLYEIVWYNMAVYYSHFDPRVFEFSALTLCVLFCIKEVYPQKPPRLSIVLYGIFIICMILWGETGFKVNYLGDANFSTTGEVFNIVSKASLAIAFAIHIGSKKIIAKYRN